MNEEELKAEGAAAERQRIAGILGSEEAKDKTGLATHLALNTSMSEADAKGLLAAAAAEPKKADKVDAPAAAATTTSATTNFQSAMDAGKHPEVGADQNAGSELSEDQQVVNRLASSFETATGRKLN